MNADDELRALETEEWVRRMLRDGEAWELIKTRRLTEQKTAKIIGTSQTAVSLYLRGKIFPRRAVCLRLARLLKKLQAMPPSGDLERSGPR